MLAFLLFTLCSRHSQANGAFPDSLQILLPPDRPDQIALATNFGLILTDDGGTTWEWSCEITETMSAFLYQVGPAPADRYYAISDVGIVFSDDEACSWQVARGSLAGGRSYDLFPDTARPGHMLGIGYPPKGEEGGPIVVESNDGGNTFAHVLYQADAKDTLIGVEIAASDPSVIYLTQYSTPGIDPKLIRSTDGGITWQVVDLAGMVGSQYVRIVAVDRQDSRRLYLRLTGASGDTLAISDDAGSTLRMAVHIEGVLGGFAVLASGTIVVGGATFHQGASTGAAFRSRDNGLTFQAWPRPPRVRALAERDGKLFIAADNFNDGYALAVSSDEGDSVRPIMKFSDVSAMKDCVKDVCERTCAFEAQARVWPPSVCGDAGALDANAGMRIPATTNSGCACATGSDSGGVQEFAVSSFSFWLLLVARANLRSRRRVVRSAGEDSL